MTTPAVVVFGASSYIGGYVIAELVRAGIHVIASSRNPSVASILIEPTSRVTLCRPEEIKEHLSTTPLAVINLAYPKDELSWRTHAANRRLVQAVEGAVIESGCKRVLHLSSQAVFGYIFDAPPEPLDAVTRSDNVYVESKIAAERYFRQSARQHGYELAIVRLGNVIGPGSPAWCARLAQRVMLGQPVGYHRQVGFSNATSVENIASYLATLTQAASHLETYHHVAEHGLTPWTTILEYIGRVVGRAPVFVERSPEEQRSVFRDSARALSYVYKGTSLGGYLRRGLGNLERIGINPRTLAALKVKVTASSSSALGSASLSADDVSLLDVMASEYPFRSHVLSTWKPPVSLADALTSIGSWLRRTGYVLEAS